MTIGKVQRAGRVFYEPNWNGGRWFVVGKHNKEYPLSEFKTFKHKLRVVVEGVTFKAIIKDVSGTDYDMGHTYYWNNVALFSIANIESLGDIEYNLSVNCVNNTEVYLEIHDE
mgnify:CR=1 FL=1